MSVTMDVARGVFEAEENSSLGNTLAIGVASREKTFNVEIDNPWAGDSESGIGRSAHITLSFDDARELVKFLTARLA